MTTPQAVFAQALFNPELPCPPGLGSWNRSDPGLRFGIYRNNVTVSLVDALASTFPVVLQLVGEDFFRAMARLFVQAHPPRSPVMARYGAGFADFIAAFPHAAGVPYLADVARLEMARVQAYHAADVPPIPAEQLQATLADPAQLAVACLQLHPSLQTVAAPHAIVSIWSAHHGGPAMAEIDLGSAETALVFRQGLEVEVMRLSIAAGRFVSALQQGQSLLHSADAAAAIDPTLDLPAILALLVRHSLFTAVHTQPTEEPHHGHHHA